MKQLMDEKVWDPHHPCALSSPGRPASVTSFCLIIWSCLIAYHTESGRDAQETEKIVPSLRTQPTGIHSPGEGEDRRKWGKGLHRRENPGEGQQ